MDRNSRTKVQFRRMLNGIAISMLYVENEGGFFVSQYSIGIFH